MTGTTPSPATDVPGARAGLALLIVLALYTLMDRQLIGLLAAPLRRDLGIDDTRFALLQGVGAALFAAAAAYPLAWLADRGDRRRVLVGCLLAWCAALVACSQAAGFGQLLAASALLGAARAGLAPIAYALIADWFTLRRRPAATASYVVLGRLAVGLPIAASGALVASVEAWRPLLPAPWQALPEWRLALAAAALPALPLALALWRGLPAARLALPGGPAGARAVTGAGAGGADRDAGGDACADAGADAASRDGAGAGPGARAEAPPPPLPWAVWLPLVAGAAALSAGSTAIGVFMPVLLVRAGDAPGAAGGALGGVALAAAAVAVALSWGLARRDAGGASGPAGLRVAAAGLALGGVGALALAMAGLAPGGAAGVRAAVLGAWWAALAGTLTALLLLVGTVQRFAPPAARARCLALFAGTMAVAGALAPLAVGLQSDAAGASADALRRAMATVAAPGFAAGALALAAAARRLARVAGAR